MPRDWDSVVDSEVVGPVDVKILYRESICGVAKSVNPVDPKPPNYT